MSNAVARVGVEAAGRGAMTDRTVADIREVLAGKMRWRSPLLFAGPAVIASIAYMDPGNFATNIQAGAKYGYALLVGRARGQCHRHAVPGVIGQARHRHRAQLWPRCAATHFPKPVV